MSGIPSWCRPGAKCICIRSDWTSRERAEYPEVQFPVEGATYTVREITTTYSPGNVDIRLVEIDNPVILFIEGPAESAFAVERFRPLTRLEDDITTHFQALLTIRNPQLESAE